MYVLVCNRSVAGSILSIFFLRPFLFSVKKKEPIVKVKFAEEVTKKKGLNFSAAKAKQVRNIALLQLREKEALDVRTRCKKAADMVTESRKTRRPSKSAVSLRTAAETFNITHSCRLFYVRSHQRFGTHA